MSQKYYAIVTNLGAAKIANAAALGTKLSITQMAVGDGGGTLPTPNASQTKLVNETRRAAINTLSIDPANASQVIAEQVIPETEGGFWIREMGLFDADGTLIAVCNTPETYKPALQEGSGRTQTVRMILIVNSTDTITLKIDPSVVLATRQYVDNAVVEVKAYSDKGMKEHLNDRDPHKQYLRTDGRIEYTGTGSNLHATDDRRKVHLYVNSDGTWGVWDDVNNRPLPLTTANGGTGDGLDGTILPVGVPVPYPLATPPVGWVQCRGQTFTAQQYPKLAKIYTNLIIPDLRGEFIRGWDDDRKADTDRVLLSFQADAFRAHTHDLQMNGSFGQQYWTPSGGDNSSYDTVITTGSTGGNETRPRNVAFNYIMRGF
jgi:hypothetical protein